MSSPVPELAKMQAVRDLVQGITPVEFSNDKVTESMRYGDTEVCTLTNIFTWDITHPQYYKAVEAANYFAASNLMPKTIADRDTGKPLFITYKQIATEICNSINVGLPDDADLDVVVVVATPPRNYYKNKNVKPFMAVEGYGGDYNTWSSGDAYSVEGV